MNHLPSVINDEKSPFTSFLRLILILAIAVATSGCGTITSLTNDHYTPEQAIAYEPITYAELHNPPLIYGGVITDAYFLKKVHPGNIWPIIELGLPVVDACFSFGADTILLPYTSYQQFFINNDFQKAAGAGNLDKVKKLLDAGQAINAKDIYGHTALMRAAWEGHTEVVQLLLDKDAAVNEQHKYSKATALKYAVVRNFDDHKKNNAEIVKLLYKEGAATNVTGEELSLQVALENNNAGMFKTILESGIDKSDIQAILHSAITWHGKWGRDGKPIIKILLDAGAPVDFDSLQSSLGEEDVTVADMLFEHGGDPNATGKCGETLLIDAYSPEKAKYLISRGSNVNAAIHVGANCKSLQDNEGMTALMQAAKYGYNEIATTLINSGADVNAITPSGQTAMTFASSDTYKSQEKQTEMINLLKKSGATR